MLTDIIIESMLTFMTPDLKVYLRNAKVTNPLREPILRLAIQELKLQNGSKGLDAGCGVGQQSMLLAESVGSNGHITGLDIKPEFSIIPQTIIFFN